MNSIRFVVCIHNHQPVGNFDHVIADSYDRAYRPFLDVVRAYPEFKFSLHTSGCLLEWVAENRAEYFDLLGTLVASGQVELVAGAMYEPIVPIWPAEQIADQIARHREFLRARFGVDARGFWLPERVWEPHLAKVLHDAGIGWVPLDDHMFLRAGLSADDLHGYYITEHEARTLAIFPVPQTLRYTIPFGKPAQSVAFLRALARRTPGTSATYADDGEKFGSWPGTHRHVYSRRWLRRFIEALLKESSWLHLAHFQTVLEETAPTGRIYLPAGSYAEMAEWSELGPGASKGRRRKAGAEPAEPAPVVHQGFWRNFLVKYPEANRLHKTVLAFAQAVDGGSAAVQPAAKARTHVLRAQCNCPYWHGVFGGLYLPHLRSAPYEQLGRARSLVPARRARVLPGDWDSDGKRDLLIVHPQFDLHLVPARGGALELVLQHDPPFNWGCTMTRRKEAYHDKIFAGARAAKGGTDVQTIHAPAAAKEKHLERHLVYDRYARASLLDHLLPASATLAKFQRSSHTELAPWILSSYAVKEQKADLVTLAHEGTVQSGRQQLAASLEKTVRLQSARPAFDVGYRLKIAPGANARFGVEWNLTTLAPTGPDRWVEIDGLPAGDPAATAQFAGVKEFGLVDRWGKKSLHVACDRPFTLWRFGLFTVSLSESGYEKVYQQTVFVTLFDLPAEGELALAFGVRLARL
jgi:alpha-amylase